MTSEGRVLAPLEVLREARLSTVQIIAGDGYPSIVSRTNDQAARVALDALRLAGYEVVPRG